MLLLLGARCHGTEADRRATRGWRAVAFVMVMAASDRGEKRG